MTALRRLPCLWSLQPPLLPPCMLPPVPAVRFALQGTPSGGLTPRYLRFRDEHSKSWSSPAMECLLQCVTSRITVSAEFLSQGDLSKDDGGMRYLH